VDSSRIGAQPLDHERTETPTAGLGAVNVVAHAAGGDGDRDKQELVHGRPSGGAFSVYPINPRGGPLSRTVQSGGKPDPGDVIVLANILRLDRHLHRRLAQISEHALAVKALARQHQESIWAWHDALSWLGSVLLEFLSQAIKAFRT
jgi:hypothetical protein